ncbi:MAG: LexA family transcriptional regulator [Acidobacteriota bacterium]|nr:LexA family transcriptional regulator [Acidobacteriota bacterium]
MSEQVQSRVLSLGRNIKRLRTVAGLQTQKAFAERLGVPQPQVSDWENDRSPVPEVPNLLKLAKALGCSVDELLAGVDPDYDRIRDGFDIAVAAEGDVLPGGTTWDEREQERPPVLGWLSRPGDLRDPSAYGVRIRGDSMLPAFRLNMIVIVSPELEVRDGDEVYVRLASGECLVRLLHTFRNGYVLQPYNPAHHARFVGPGEIEAMHVIVYSRGPDDHAGDVDVGSVATSPR